MKDMKENIKIGLLGVIALTLIVNTWYAASKKSGSATTEVKPGTSAAVAEPGGAPAPLIGAPTNPNPDLSTTLNTSTDPLATPPSNGKSTRMSFGTYSHDFGKIKQNSTNKYAFRFTNTGDEPLIISNAVGSCGCTVPDYPKEPVAPGASAVINVEYKPGLQKGAQEKKVTVTANTDPSTTTLVIKAEVQEE